jgi:hypothetical protein
VRAVVGFQQAAARIEKEQEFEDLKGAIERAFGPEKVEEFLRQAQSRGIRVRDLEAVLAKGILERIDATLAKSGAQTLYQALALSDQGQIREFYLSKIEEVEPRLRAKFQKLYRYY